MSETREFKRLPLDAAGNLIENKCLILSPRNMVIISFPKMGKTESLTNVPGVLIGDCQGGTAYYNANNVADILRVDEGEQPYQQLASGAFIPRGLFETVDELNKANNMPEYWKLYKQFTDARGAEKEELQKDLIAFIQAMPFPVFVIDPITELMENLKGAALMDYNTQMGRNKTNIKRVDDYGGSQYIRRTLIETKQFIENNAAPFIIYTGHIKEKKKILQKAGEEISAADMDLEGTLSTIFTQHADAVCVFYRDEEGCWLTFEKKDETDFDSRPPHVAGQKIKIADLHTRDRTGKITAKGRTHWDKIFPELRF